MLHNTTINETINDFAQSVAQDFVKYNTDIFNGDPNICSLKIANLLRFFAIKEEEKIKEALKDFVITPK